MRKSDVRTAENIDQHLAATRKIKFRDDTLVNETSTIRNIFSTLISNEPETTYMRGGSHCPRGRYRSLYDFTKLSKQYRPNTTIKDIIFLLFDYYYDSQNRQVKRLYYCPDIRRYNFRVRTYGYAGLSPTIIRDITFALRTDYPSLGTARAGAIVQEYANEFLAARNRQ